MLGVTPTATSVEVEHAFRVVARRSHPDVGGHPGAFRAATEARAVMLAPRPPAQVGVDRVVDIVVRYHPVVLLAEVLARTIDRHIVRVGSDPSADRRP